MIGVITPSNLERKEAVVQRCSVKKVFFEISQNPTENTCARVSFLQNTSGRLLLKENYYLFQKNWRPKNFSSIFRVHCVKSIQIRSYFWSVFSCILTEITPYLDTFHVVAFLKSIQYFTVTERPSANKDRKPSNKI